MTAENIFHHNVVYIDKKYLAVIVATIAIIQYLNELSVLKLVKMRYVTT